MPFNTFDAYVKVSELYFGRKSDSENAIFYYGEALKVMTKNGRDNDRFPYFHIDMGNMFYANKLFPQAKKCYLIAITAATKLKDSFAMSIAQNNIGLVCREEADYSSACIFFKKSMELRKKQPLYVAHNLFYMASIFVRQNVPDSILYYRNLAMEALKSDSLLTVDSNITKDPNDSSLVQDLITYDAELMAGYYKSKKQYLQAIPCYQIASERASRAKDFPSASSYVYSLATLYDKIQNQKQAVISAELSYQIAVSAKDNDLAATSARLLNRLYQQQNNRRMADFYLQKIFYHADLKNQLDASQEKQSAKILLITHQVEDSLRIYKYNEERSRKIIIGQSLAIVLVFFLLILVSILAFFLHKKKMQIKEVRLAKITEVLKNIEIDKGLKEQKKNEITASLSNLLEVRLAILMDIKAVYAQHDISLAKLAALLDTNTTYLSQYFNLQLETNFNDYINSYRVKEACRIFDRDTSLKYSIEQVADMVGFSSRTTFYTAFKKFTGMTPAFFQKNISNLSLKTQLLEWPSGKK